MLIRNCVMQKGEKMKIFFETQSSEVTGSSHLVTINYNKRQQTAKDISGLW